MEVEAKEDMVLVVVVVEARIVVMPLNGIMEQEGMWGEMALLVVVEARALVT